MGVRAKHHASWICRMGVGFGWLTISLALTAGAEEPKDAWFIDSSGTSGVIQRSASEADLIQHFGAKNVKSGPVDTAEGEHEFATLLFPDDPESRITIFWRDADKRANPSRAQVDGAKSRWQTFGGITLGTTLKELEKLNGGSFTLFGFGWDYSGSVTSWDNGKLEAPFRKEGRVTLRLIPSGNGINETPEYQLLLGDRSFSSANPAMQKLNPAIYQIIWMFR